MVPLPGKAIPRASLRQFIELAVNIPEQLPQVGQATCSRTANSPAAIRPLLTAPTPSKIEIRSTARPSGIRPAAIGPPETNIEGILTRMAAISMPGTILSQLGIKMAPSKAWARSMVSTESAINSREGKLQCMPACPMMMPSSTPMVLNSKGTPPASRI